MKLDYLRLCRGMGWGTARGPIHHHEALWPLLTKIALGTKEIKGDIIKVFLHQLSPRFSGRTPFPQ